MAPLRAGPWAWQGSSKALSKPSCKHMPSVRSEYDISVAACAHMDEETQCMVVPPMDTQDASM